MEASQVARLQALTRPPTVHFRQAYPGVPIYVRALDMQHAAALQEAGGRGGAPWHMLACRHGSP